MKSVFYNIVQNDRYVGRIIRLRPIMALLALIAGALTTPQTAAAQVSHTVHGQGIDITMALDKTKAQVGEPITLTITLENVSEAPLLDITSNFQLPEGNSLDVTVQPPGELPYRYSGALEIGTYPVVPLKLIKGNPQKVSTLLLYDRTQDSGLLFPRPGNYSLAVAFSYQTHYSPDVNTAVLPPVNIEITEATGANAGVLKILDAPGYIRMVHLGVTPTTGSVQIVHEAADRYPGTELGALALRAEGLNYTRGTAQDYERGAALLQEFLANGVIPIEPDSTVWEIAAAYHRAGKYDLAREWTYYLIRNYPQSTRIRPEDALIYYYYLEPAKFAMEVPWYLLKEPWVVPGLKPPTDLKPRKLQ